VPKDEDQPDEIKDEEEKAEEAEPVVEVEVAKIEWKA
jgi:hypothetical protein